MRPSGSAFAETETVCCFESIDYMVDRGGTRIALETGTSEPLGRGYRGIVGNSTAGVFRMSGRFRRPGGLPALDRVISARMLPNGDRGNQDWSSARRNIRVISVCTGQLRSPSRTDKRKTTERSEGNNRAQRGTMINPPRGTCVQERTSRDALSPHANRSSEGRSVSNKVVVVGHGRRNTMS